MAHSTKLALAGALREQLEKRFLDDITVKALVEACQVNRQTFYYHFQDIYDLLRWFLEHETEEALSEADTWQEALLAVFRYVQGSHMVVYHIYRSSGRELLEGQLRSMARAIAAENVTAAARVLGLSEEDQAFLADFFMYAISGMVVGWFAGDMREEPEALVARLSRLLEGEFRRAAETFAPAEPAV